MLSSIIEFERLHLLESVRSGKSVDPRYYQDLNESLNDESIREKLKSSYDQKLYPLFEKYHIPRDFDNVIDNIAQTIRNYLVDYVCNSRGENLSNIINVDNLNKDERNQLLNTSINKFDKNVHITPYSYDIDKRECVEKNFADIDKDKSFKEATQNQFPIVLYFYENFRNIGISPEIIDVKQTGHKIKIVKFSISLPLLINYLNSIPYSSIKTLVRHEVLHIVERFVNNGKDLSFFLKRKEKAPEIFDYLKYSGYSDNEIISIDSDIMLFSESEMNARVNELYSAIKGMSNEEIEDLVRSDNLITIKAIMKLFKHFSSVSLIYMMDNFKDTIFKAINDINSDSYRETLGVLLVNTEYKVFGNIRNPKYQKNDEVQMIMKEFLEQVIESIEKFEMRCYKMIYHVLKEKKFDVTKSVLEKTIEDFGRYTDLFENGLIYYLYDVDNNFGTL